ncbi:hypothetical protein IFR05_007422 [Cadophora sp. M221]|nr:hypothetical protein IFR05_007422 [Cadophora sp. M221]
MSLTLHPRQRDGLMRWERDALILHFFWGWQFIVACGMELLIFGEILGSQFSADYKNREMRYYYTFFWLIVILLITIVAEICLFANEHLEVNKWLALQIFKLAFAATAFGVTPWVAGLVCGLLAKWQDGRESKEDLVIEEEARRPLLPRRISAGERRAVYR